MRHTSRLSDEQAAQVAYAAVRQLREAQGCPRGPVWGLLVSEERTWYAKAVERAALGCTPSIIHSLWCEEMARDGWKPGPEIDHAKRTHPDLAPWESLGEPARRRLFLLQQVVIGLYLEVPAALTAPLPVIAPLRCVLAADARPACLGLSWEYHGPLVLVCRTLPRKAPR